MGAVVQRRGHRASDVPSNPPHHTYRDEGWQKAKEMSRREKRRGFAPVGSVSDTDSVVQRTLLMITTPLGHCC